MCWIWTCQFQSKNAIIKHYFNRVSVRGELKMSWPLPSLSLKEESSQLWMDEYLGPNIDPTNVGEGIKIFPFVVIVENDAYLTFGANLEKQHP